MGRSCKQLVSRTFGEMLFELMFFSTTVTTSKYTTQLLSSIVLAKTQRRQSGTSNNCSTSLLLYQVFHYQVCCCGYNAVRGHRTGSSNSGPENYLSGGKQIKTEDNSNKSCLHKKGEISVRTYQDTYIYIPKYIYTP